MTDLFIAAAGVVASIVGYLLAQKDKQQEEEINGIKGDIKTLFNKHDIDAEALQDLRVQIAAKHYERPELDAKFDKLENTVKEGFLSLGARLDKLNDALLNDRKH